MDYDEVSVSMILFCPLCHSRHIDEGEYATLPHHTHACQSCGNCWRPAICPTRGVQFLPGFKNELHSPVDGRLRGPAASSGARCSFDAYKPIKGNTGGCVLRGEHEVHEDKCGNRWRYNEEDTERYTLIRRLETSPEACGLREPEQASITSNLANLSEKAFAVVKIDYFKPSGKWYTSEETPWPVDADRYLVPFEEILRIKGMHAVCLENPLGFPQMHVHKENAEP